LGFQNTSNWQIFTPNGRKYLNAAERERFLIAAADEQDAVCALCIYLVFCGCRISEALALTLDHIERPSNIVTMRTLKRRKLAFRQVPLPDRLVDMIVSIAPDQGRVWPIHRATAWRWVTRVMERAAINGPMACCRGTRHAFAIHALWHKVPPNLLQKWMGHASFETTAIYLEAVGEDERNFAERMW
jgi:integrase/recombinase XerD